MEQLRECMTRDDLAKEVGTELALAWNTDITNASEELLRNIKLEGLQILSELDTQIKEYFDKKALVDKLNAELKEQNRAIVYLMTETYKLKKYIGDGYSATVAYKESIKYKDENSLIKLLKEDDTLKSYVIEAVDDKALNELIKNSESVATKLKESYSKSTSSSLTVKKI